MSNSSVNVLVVDDDLAVCRILHRMLSDEEYQVQISQSVADAGAAIELKRFDVYVMDFKLPDGTGLDIAEKVRAKGSEAPIILISGYDPSAVAVRAEKLRISDIIEKPFSRARICDAVKKAIGFSPGAQQSAVEAVDPVVEAVASKKGFSKAAIIGSVIFLLLLSCLAFYLVAHAH
jgi:two-component system, NtrC family, response regulator HydG